MLRAVSGRPRPHRIVYGKEEQPYESNLYGQRQFADFCHGGGDPGPHSRSPGPHHGPHGREGAGGGERRFLGPDALYRAARAAHGVVRGGGGGGAAALRRLQRHRLRPGAGDPPHRRGGAAARRAGHPAGPPGPGPVRGLQCTQRAFSASRPLGGALQPAGGGGGEAPAGAGGAGGPAGTGDSGVRGGPRRTARRRLRPELLGAV